MSTWDRRYTDRVQLLLDILPMLAQEPRFALKGGTASICSSTIFPACRWTLT